MARALLVARRQIAVDAQAQQLAAVEHRLHQCDIVAQQQLIGCRHGKGCQQVVCGQVGVEAVEDFGCGDLVFEGDLLEDVVAGNGVD